MTYPGSAGFRSVDQGRRSKEADRSAWAYEGREVVVWETEGAGSIVTPVITFERTFENQPAFHYGVKDHEQTPLILGDYPFVSAGVAEWGVVQANVEGRVSWYTAATVWMTVASSATYRLIWTFTFIGTVMRNSEHIGGA